LFSVSRSLKLAYRKDPLSDLMTRPVSRQKKADAAIAAVSLDRTLAATLQIQFAEQLRRMILLGRILPGARLPSSRELAAELGVSRATIVAAIDQLKSEGYVDGRQGSGCYVSPSLPEQALQIKPSITSYRMQSASRCKLQSTKAPRPFQLGATDASLFPYDIWARLLYRIWRRPQAELVVLPDPFGWPALRQAIAEHLRDWRGISCCAAQVIITSGAADATELIARSVFKSGDKIFVEEPGFPTVRHALSNAGLFPLPVPVDEEGFNVEPAISKHRARGAFVTPSRQFPLGATLPLARRLELLDWAQSTGSYVVEDDFDSEYRYEGSPLPALMSLDRNAVAIYVGSFSKVLSPTLRLGFLVVPERLLKSFHQYICLRGATASLVCQPVLAEFMSAGFYATHIRRARRCYSRRKSALLQASDQLRGLLKIAPTSAGMHLVAELSPALSKRMTDVEAARRAERVGVNTPALSNYYAGTPNRRALLLGFAGFPEDVSLAAINRLGAALRR
jgi:GntR family transcriptional regulator / MocR family aminotransferase